MLAKELYEFIGLRVYVQDSGFLIWVWGVQGAEGFTSRNFVPTKARNNQIGEVGMFLLPWGPRTQIIGL